MNKALWGNPEWVKQAKARLSEKSKARIAEGTEFKGKKHSAETLAVMR